METIEGFLSKRSQLGLLRTLRPFTLRRQGHLLLQDKEYIDFSSNDYLGLSSHPKLIQISKTAIDKYGLASSASRLMSGDLELHHQLEAKIAQFKNKEAGLVFNSGYQANIGVIPALFERGDGIFLDRFSHASIIDGVILSGARFFRFPHNDIAGLEAILKRERNKFNKALIITESIFSMDGDKAPLKELVELKEKYNCLIYVDEAHATGIFGQKGSGVVGELGLSGKIDFIMGTFSKALGGFGAYLATSKIVVKYLVNTCRSFIYSTALPPAIIAGNLLSIDLIKEEPWRRHILIKQAQYFRERLRDKDFNVKGESQIVPVIIGDNLKTVAFAQALKERGYWVCPIRPPTVPEGEGRLRFSLTVHHNRGVLDELIDDIDRFRV